jgi:hypothetical protein
MNVTLSILAFFFLLINPTYSQLYEFNQNFLEGVKTNAINTNDVEVLKIATIDADAIMLEPSSNPKKYLEVLRTLKQLKILQFENLQLISSRDTFFEFTSNISDPTVNVVPYGLDLSPYSILSFLDAFEELEILELNFLGMVNK